MVEKLTLVVIKNIELKGLKIGSQVVDGGEEQAVNGRAIEEIFRAQLWAKMVRDEMIGAMVGGSEPNFK